MQKKEEFLVKLRKKKLEEEREKQKEQEKEKEERRNKVIKNFKSWWFREPTEVEIQKELNFLERCDKRSRL